MSGFCTSTEWAIREPKYSSVPPRYAGCPSAWWQPGPRRRVQTRKQESHPHRDGTMRSSSLLPKLFEFSVLVTEGPIDHAHRQRSHQ
jgi:hypothetical protein